MTDLEQRLFYLEQLMSRIDYAMNQLKNQVNTASQNQRQDSGSSGAPPADSGAGWTLYSCTVPSAVTGPATIPGVALTPLMGPGAGATATISVGIPGPTVAGKNGYVVGSGGNYYLIAQSCT